MLDLERFVLKSRLAHWYDSLMCIGLWQDYYKDIQRLQLVGLLCWRVEIKPLPHFFPVHKCCELHIRKITAYQLLGEATGWIPYKSKDFRHSHTHTHCLSSSGKKTASLAVWNPMPLKDLQVVEAWSAWAAESFWACLPKKLQCIHLFEPFRPQHFFLGFKMVQTSWNLKAPEREAEENLGLVWSSWLK